MDTQNQNTDQSPDNAAAGEAVMPLAAELGPNGLPVHPPQGEEPAAVDHDLIMDTFFGEGSMEPKSGAGQAKEPNASGDQSDQGTLAPPAAASAANGEEGSSGKPGPSSTPAQQTGEGQAGAEGKAPQTPGQDGTASPEPKPAAQELSVEDRLKLAEHDALREQNRQLMERLSALERGGGQQQQQGQGQKPQTEQPGAGTEPPLRLVVPNDLYDGIFSEDRNTSQAAMSLLITGVAQNAVNAAKELLGPMIDQRMAQVTQAIQAGEQISKMEDDYYKRFPSHKNELFKQLIQSVVDEKYKLFPNAPWDDIMIDAVGSTVNARLTALGIDPATMQQNGKPLEEGQNGQGLQANGDGRPKPAPMLDATNRGGSGESKVPSDSGDFIASTFR